MAKNSGLGINGATLTEPWAKHYPMLTLMKIFGWKTPSMAARYYHPDEKELLAGVDAMKRESHS